MKQVSVHEAKAHFCAVLKQVSEGETIVITKHDQPVAEISPVTKKSKVVVGAFADPSAPHLEVSWTDEELDDLFGTESDGERPKL
jgi:prevent-host-death family protein